MRSIVRRSRHMIKQEPLYPERGDTHTSNCDAWVPKEKELVQPRYDDSPDEPHEPCAECGTRHIGIVGISDGGTHFGVRRVVLCGMLDHPL